MVVKGTEQQNIFLELGVFAMSLETLPEFNDMCNGTVPNSLHEDVSYFSMGKFCHPAQGNKSLIVVKRSDQREIFEKLGLFTINLEMLPHFQDLNDRTLPDHLHDEVLRTMIYPNAPW
ncbi:hypothetical protein TNCV_533381 [Trichonephila clavipes]|nr:hypothetical protein TNCV_533381 [Trichonephila clavipes]